MGLADELERAVREHRRARIEALRNDLVEVIQRHAAEPADLVFVLETLCHEAVGRELVRELPETASWQQARRRLDLTLAHRSDDGLEEIGR
jgi:septum formation topological specificity factor MinE